MDTKGKENAARLLIHHFDLGIQYCAAYYQQLHRRHGLTRALTDGYDGCQNAVAERVNAILKMAYPQEQTEPI